MMTQGPWILLSQFERAQGGRQRLPHGQLLYWRDASSLKGPARASAQPRTAPM
jgi:hypothetical protein